MLSSGLDLSIPAWTIWASHPSGLHTWNSGEEDNHCLFDNDLLRAYCVSYSLVIIRIIKKNKTWPYLSNLVVEQTCQQITQIRVVSATVHVWARLSRGIKKRLQGVPIINCTYANLFPWSHEVKWGCHWCDLGYLPISQEVMKSNCINYKGAKIYAQLPQRYRYCYVTFVNHSGFCGPHIPHM